jgi:hypothetical protein
MTYLKEINDWIDKQQDNILEILSGLIRIKTENSPPHGYEKTGQGYLAQMPARVLPEKVIDLFEIDNVRGIREHPLFYSRMYGRAQQT